MTPAMFAILVELALKYGPEFVSEIVALMKQKEISVDDVHNLFSNVKPYAAYNIPEAPVVAPEVTQP